MIRLPLLLLLLLLLTVAASPAFALNPSYGATLATFSGGSDALWWPVNLALDSSNSVYVTDELVSDNYYAGRGRIVKYSSAGADLTSDLNSQLLDTFLIEFLDQGVYYEQDSLNALALDASDSLYTNNYSTIVKLSKNAQSLLMTFPSIYSDVSGLTVDKTTGNVFVFSPTDGSMYVQSSNGTLLYSYSTAALGNGTNLEQLCVIGSTGLLLAVDITNSVGYWLSLNGTVVNSYAWDGLMTGCAVDASNNAWLMIADMDSGGYYDDGINWRLLSFAAPAYTAMTTYPINQAYAYFVSMAFGTDQLLYLADYELARVSIFTPSTGQITGQIRNGWTPSYFSTDNSGNVYLCDTNTGDLLMLNSDGSPNKYFSITAFADGNSLCTWSIVNPAGTILSTTAGAGTVTVNGTLDGQMAYFFNVASGQLINSVRLSTDSLLGLDSLAVDNSGNVYYNLDADVSTIHVITTSGAAVRDIALRQDANYSFYAFSMDSNQYLNVFYIYNNNSAFIWDQLTATGTARLTKTVALFSNATHMEYMNGPRVDYLGYLYYMIRIYGSQGDTGAGAETQIRVLTPNGTILPFWTDASLLDDPYTLSIDGAGNVYTDDASAHKIIKWTGVNFVYSPGSNGGSSTVAGYALDGWVRGFMVVGISMVVACLCG